MKKRVTQKLSPTDRVAFTVRIPRALRDELKFTSLRKGVSVQTLAERRLRTQHHRRKVDTNWLRTIQVGELKVKGPLRRRIFYEA